MEEYKLEYDHVPERRSTPLSATTSGMTGHLPDEPRVTTGRSVAGKTTQEARDCKDADAADAGASAIREAHVAYVGNALKTQPFPRAQQSYDDSDQQIADAYHTNTEGSAAKAQEPHVPKAPPPTPPPRYGIDDRISEIRRFYKGTLPHVNCPGGDTWIFIDAPEKEDGQSDFTYRQIKDRFDEPLLMHKHLLTNLQSPYFDTLFGPTAQYRTLRSRKLVGRLPQGIKYILDLTPPTVDEEAVQLTSELDLPYGIRHWVEAGARWHISPQLIGGHDEYTEIDPARREAIPSYTPLRHRLAIERFLLATANEDPCLDSAPKLYSALAVSKHFQVGINPLTDWAIRWIQATPNSYIMEVYPEIVLYMAECLQCESLCRDVFAVLVGEQALEEACVGSTSAHVGKILSVHLRKYNPEVLSEEFESRIEYARRMFHERVLATFNELVDAEMTWFDTLPEYQKLKNHSASTDSLEAKREIADLVQNLKTWIRGAIWVVLSTDYAKMPEKRFVEVADKALALFPDTRFSTVWNGLEWRGRIQTASFWHIVAVIGRRWSNRWLRSMFRSLEENNLSFMYEPVYKKGVTRKKIEENSGTSFEDLEMHELVRRLSHCHATVQKAAALEGTADSAQPSSGTSKGHWALPSRMKRGTRGAKNVSILDANAAENSLTLPGEWEDDEEDGEEMRKLANSSQTRTDAAFFSIDAFFTQAGEFVTTLSGSMLGLPSSGGGPRSMLDMALSDYLVCLDEAEMNFLPLWAGGLDDGTGGVFNPIPFPADDGANLMRGRLNYLHSEGSSRASSDYSLVNDGATSGGDTSRVAVDGFSDTLDRKRVYSDTGSQRDWGGTSSDQDDAYSFIGGESTLYGEGDMTSEAGGAGPATGKQSQGGAEQETSAVREAEQAETLEQQVLDHHGDYDDFFLRRDSDEEDEFEDPLSGSDASFDHIDELEGERGAHEAMNGADKQVEETSNGDDKKEKT